MHDDGVRVYWGRGAVGGAVMHGNRGDLAGRARDYVSHSLGNELV